MDYLPQQDTDKQKEKTFQNGTAVLVAASTLGIQKKNCPIHKFSYRLPLFTRTRWDQTQSCHTRLGNRPSLVSEALSSDKLHAPRGSLWALSLWLMTERKRTKIFHVLKSNLIKKYIYSTSICLLKCTKNIKISSLLCPIIMVCESVHFLIRLECLQL